MEGAVYGGIYCPDSSIADKDSLRSDIRSGLTHMNMPNMRFPGGNFASGYRWMDGVGPIPKRPTRYDLAWRRPVSNHYGTDEFIWFCREMNI